MKDELTKNEFYALEGLRFVAQRYRSKLSDIEEMIGEVIGEESPHLDWSMEIAWNCDDDRMDDLLEKMGVKVNG